MKYRFDPLRSPSPSHQVPVWAKMTPNITDITKPAAAALANGCEGIAAINTINCVMGVNLDTLRSYSERGRRPRSWGLRRAFRMTVGKEMARPLVFFISVLAPLLLWHRPEPSVEGYSTPGGYSYRSVKPIALAKVMSLAQVVVTRGLAAGREG